MAKIMEEYSVLYPATNSASASVRSKGVRFVSASIDIKKIIAQGSNGTMNQIVCVCEKTILVKFKDPVKRITGKMTKPMETSYDIICAAERNAPRKAYFELLAHPAIIILYTLNDDIAKINNKV